MSRLRASQSLPAFFGFAVFVVLATTAAAQNVWTVDDNPGPGVQFTTIQPAVDAATSGDMIVIRAGTYPAGFSVSAKGLVIAAEPNVAFSGNVPILVENLNAAQSFVMRGLRPTSGTMRGTLRNNLGPVVLEDCKFSEIFGFPFGALAATDCASLIVVACEFFGAGHVLGQASHGADLLRTHLAAYDSLFVGGAGYDAIPSNLGCVNGKPGGDGLHIVDGSVFVNRCTFVGGKGGKENAFTSSSCTGGNGGDGIEIQGSTPAAALNCAFTGGMHGISTPPGTPPLDGLPVKSNVMFPMTLGPARTYSISSPVKEQQTISLSFDLPAPTDVFLFLSPDPGFPLYVGGVIGPLLNDLAALDYISFGTLPAGNTTIAVPAGDLPPSLMGSYLMTQPIYLDATFSFIEAGNPSHLLLLDGSL
jgi:hypothetical protein